MNSLKKLQNTISGCSQLKIVSGVCIPLFVISMLFLACTNTEDFANPLDSENLRTAGAPDGLKLYPGDKQVRVTWIGKEGEGIKTYKIYRRSDANSDEPFELVGTVDAPASEFVDTLNIENDRRDSSGVILAYEYRISYVDINGIEAPDPTNLPNLTDEPFQLWKTAIITPSIPPPAPVITIGEPSDLTVKLFWDGYDFPNDFALFRIYIARDTGDENQLVFKNVAEIERDQLYYFDLNFRQDGEKRIYHIAAVDDFGVEAITTINATSPNLPPSPPQGFRAQYFRRSPLNFKYDVVLTWNKNVELDLDGYRIYSKDAEDNLLPRRKARRGETSVTISGEDPIIIDQIPFFRAYFITAFDNTPNPDGTPDESELVEANSF